MPSGTLGEEFNFVLQERHCSEVIKTSQGGFQPQKEPVLALLANGPKNGSKYAPKSPNLLKSMLIDPYMLLKSSKAS